MFALGFQQRRALGPELSHSTSSEFRFHLYQGVLLALLRRGVCEFAYEVLDENKDLGIKLPYFLGTVEAFGSL